MASSGRVSSRHPTKVVNPVNMENTCRINIHMWARTHLGLCLRPAVGLGQIMRRWPVHRSGLHGEISPKLRCHFKAEDVLRTSRALYTASKERIVGWAQHWRRATRACFRTRSARQEKAREDPAWEDQSHVETSHMDEIFTINRQGGKGCQETIHHRERIS